MRFGRVRRIVTSLWVRLLVTAGLLALVASKIDWSTMASRITHGNPVDFVIAVALVACALGIGMVRWHLLLRALGVRLEPGRLVRIYEISEFSGSFLPATVGGEVARVLLVTRRGRALVPTILSVVLDRAGGFAGMIGMAWIALAFDAAAVPHHARAFLLWVTVAVALISAHLPCDVAAGLTDARLVDTAPLCHADAEVPRSAQREDPSPSGRSARRGRRAFSFQALIVLQLVFLARAIGVTLPFSTAAVSLALVTLATLLPISIGGFGVREGTYVLLLGSVGIGATDATLISLLSVATLFLVSLPGAYFLVREGVRPAIEEVAR